MRITNLKINGFGKLSNKEINLDNKINIIYGKNEAGKSTLLNFIHSIFYGVSKNKNGKNISDFEKYLPWKTDDFSGKISFELDSNESYEIFRDFKKKNPVIYNSNKQDISLNYPIDKNKGIDFLYYQVNVDEDIFKNTIIVAQNDIKVDKNVQNGMIQKISNIVSSGDETVSYNKILDKINKLQLEEIGTDRTREKPINLINDKIRKLEKSKEKLASYKKFLEENNQEVQKIQDEVEEEKIKLALYRVIKESNEKSKIKMSEIEVVKNIRDEYFDKIEQLDEKIDKNIKEKIKNERPAFLFSLISIFILIITSVICFFLKVKKIISISLFIIAISILIVDIIKRIKFNNLKRLKLKEIEELEKKIEQEINILRNNIKIRQNEIEIKQNEIKDAENEVNRLVMNSFEEYLDSDFIEEAFEFESDELDRKIVEKNEKINSLKIEIGAKKNQKNAMQEELDNIANIEEELDILLEEKNELLSLNNSYNLAKQCIENAYENIRSNLSPEFIKRLSEIANKISNGKYQKINFIDTDGLIIQVEDGRFFPIERLSQGTIDQMYLGLRLSSIDTIIKEKLPIILDESFAFFDDDRLKNILEFINENYKNRQIIILTCSNREIELLNKLNIDYNYIDLEM